MEELENVRKKALNKTLICYTTTILISLLSFLFLPFFGVFILIFGLIISSLLTSKDIKKFKILYRQKIVIETFKLIFTDINFDLNRGIERSKIASTNMMVMGDVFHSNDYVSAKYKNINFELSDVKIEERYRDSDGHTHYTIIFKGQWYIFDFNKTFKADIQVCEKNFRNAKRGSFFSNDKFKKLELEDIEFNKQFKVYAKNELDAFYVLTPNTMEKIKTVNQKIEGKLLLCFIDNKLHIGLHNNKDLFEASIFKKVNLEDAINKTKNEISIITNFIDILSLDNDLFKLN